MVLSGSTPAASPAGESDPCTPLIGNWICPRAGLDSWERGNFHVTLGKLSTIFRFSTRTLFIISAILTRLPQAYTCTRPDPYIARNFLTEWYLLKKDTVRWSQFLFIEGPRSRCYGRTAALKAAYCATLWWRWWGFFCFPIWMEHRWNETDRGKPKYSEKNLS
jgi:hypothetical protein